MGKPLSDQLDRLNQLCQHCGDSCDNPIVYQGQSFCCRGCRVVYQLLQSHHLQDFYQITPYPGLKPDKETGQQKIQDGGRYAFLDHETILRDLITIRRKDRARVSLKLPTMHCASCVWLLENLYRINPAIYSVRVDFLKRQANIGFVSTKITLRALVEILASIGYPPEFNLETKRERGEKPSSLSPLIIQIAVAGFCFGNIMLFSLPEYFGIGEREKDFARFFSYANIILTLPVLFYCGRNYFSSAISGIKLGMINIDVPIALGISTLFIRSVYEVMSGNGSGYFDSLSGLIFFLLLGRGFQELTYHQISFDRDNRDYFPIAVNQVVGKGEKVVPIKNILPGDRMRIYPGQIIPVDSRLLSPKASLDLSFMTGESRLVIRKKGHLLSAGGRNGGGKITVEAVKSFSQSSFMDLWNQDFCEDKASSFSHSSSFHTEIVNRLSKVFTIVVIGMALAGAGYWGIWEDWGKAVQVFTAVLIVACPCALALSSPVTLGMGLRILNRNGLYIKSAEILEKISTIDTVVFDKTGTLTDSSIARLSQLKNLKNFIFYQGKPLPSRIYPILASLSKCSSHPLSVSLSTFLSEYLPKKEITIENYREYPGLGVSGRVGKVAVRYGSRDFVINSSGKSRIEQVKGALFLHKIKNENKIKDRINNKKGIVYSEVHISLLGKYYGVFSIQQSYRKGLTQMLSALGQRYRLALLTGDTRKNQEEQRILSAFFTARDGLKFKQTPIGKQNWIQAQRRKGKSILMIGDGLNDAGALQESDVGVAFTEDVRGFSPRCDAIMEAKVFDRIPNLLCFAHHCRKVIFASFLISFCYNFIGLYFSLGGKLTPMIAAILMPISSITVILSITLMMLFLSKYYLRRKRRRIPMTEEKLKTEVDKFLLFLQC